MAKRRFLLAAAVPAAVSALIGGVPAAAQAAAQAGGINVPGGGGPVVAGTAVSAVPGPLTPALAAQLSANADDPVIVLLKSQAAAAGATPAARAAAAAASQAPLLGELAQVDARAVKRFALVNSVAATVSALEAQRLAADPAVAQVIPDATFSVPGPDNAGRGTTGHAATGPAASAAPARTISRRPNDIPDACAATGKSQLAPEGLALTDTASASSAATTARSLGFTGAGVKVAYIADGLDTGNVNFKRAGGSSAFTDYKDFTGNGPDAPTTGGEAFLDANTIAGQGTHVYNLNGFSAQSYAGTTCDVRIEGAAPGASLVGLDVFSGDPSDTLTTTTSTFAQAINYAVENDKVNVLNESFGGNTLPDTAQDVIRLFDDAAVKAGVVVSASSGDSGTANTIGSPATDPNVISVGATTQFQAYAQANIGGSRYFATKGWLSDNVSSLSSAGFDEAGSTVDLVAPGDLSWASCDASARYSECVNAQGRPSAVEEAGGTSESAPFVSGAAALVIQAYRKTHGGKTPTPAQVKAILLSTAADLGTPAQEQGAGLLDSAKAVQLAESYGLTRRTGATLLTTPGQLTSSAAPLTKKTWQVTVANEGTKAQTVSFDSRSLKPAPLSQTSGAVSLSDANSNQYQADSGAQSNYATFTFKVPARQGRLDVSLAYAADPTSVLLAPEVTLIDPGGRVAADSAPQGVGGYGNVDVRAPAAGTWTGIIAGPRAADGGFNGKVTWRAVTQNYGSLGSISPRSVSLAPGQAKSVTLSVAMPASPGDLAGSVLVHSSVGDVTSVPVVLRSQVDVAAGGRFAGDLTGGNGRGALGTGDYYQFTVPSGTKALRAQVQLSGNSGAGNTVGAYLVGPGGNVEGYGQNTDLYGQEVGLTGPSLTATALSPLAGTWTLIVAFGEPVSGTEVADPYTGTVAFTAAGTETPAASPLPAGATLVPGTADTVPVKITNNSNAPQDYFLDPRLSTATAVALAPVAYGATQPYDSTSGSSALPVADGENPPMYFVPSLTTSLALKQTSSVPAMTDLTTVIGGDPDVGIPGLSSGSLCGTSTSESYAPSGGAVTSGLWVPAPAECGPYGTAGAKAGTATDTLTATTPAFDKTVAVSTGDYEQLATSAAAGNAALQRVAELQPGKSATVNVTFNPTGAAGATDTGTLYLDALAGDVPPFGQQSADEVAALPYSYKVG